MKTPLFVTILFVSVLITGSVHLIGVYEVIHQWAILRLVLGNLVYYVLLTNLTLSIAALGVLVAIWFRFRKAKSFIIGYILLFVLFYWLDQFVFFANKEYYRLPFRIGFQVVIGLVLTYGLSRKSVKAYFGEIHA